MSLRVAVIGAGPAGMYAADLLTKSPGNVSVDILERLPAPYGLVRYGVAPDHPRIKEVITALARVLSNPDVRFLGNVDVGGDVYLEDLRQFYDGVVVATGASVDRSLGVPGEGLPGSFGAADFVSWYNAHPDSPVDWDLSARQVAVVGAGNVALDVARILARSASEMMTTDIPPNVAAGLRAKRAADVHVFARRGPAFVKFTPVELRELAQLPTVDVVVHPEGFDVDEAGMNHIAQNKQAKMTLDVLANWVGREPAGKPNRLHLHFLERPVALAGDSRVTALRTERMRNAGDGSVLGTGFFTDWDVQSVYRAVGYRSVPVPGMPFDEGSGTVPNVGGRVVDMGGCAVAGLYVTGWVKRGPVGLIGHTKGDAAETVANLLADARPSAGAPGPDAVDAFLRSRGVSVVDKEGWARLDSYERSLGQGRPGGRVKVRGQQEMLGIANPTADAGRLLAEGQLVPG